jgi:hypothetical protein
MTLEQKIDRLIGYKPPAPVRRAKRQPAASGEPGSALRVLRILRRLQSGRWCRIGPLAEEFSCDEKTVRRALAVIRKAGFRLESKSEAFGRLAYRLSPGGSRSRGPKKLRGNA